MQNVDLSADISTVSYLLPPADTTTGAESAPDHATSRSDFSLASQRTCLREPCDVACIDDDDESGDGPILYICSAHAIHRLAEGTLTLVSRMPQQCNHHPLRWLRLPKKVETTSMIGVIFTAVCHCRLPFPQVAGAVGIPGFADGHGANARFNCPTGLCLSPSSTVTTISAGRRPRRRLLVADSNNHRLRLIDLDSAPAAVWTLA